MEGYYSVCGSVTSSVSQRICAVPAWFMIYTNDLNINVDRLDSKFADNPTKNGRVAVKGYNKL